jgi:hypothetical protein
MEVIEVAQAYQNLMKFGCFALSYWGFTCCAGTVFCLPQCGVKLPFFVDNIKDLLK